MGRMTDATRRWEWAGILAAVIILVALPVYYSVVERNPHGAIPKTGSKPAFVGTLQCRDCHNREYEAWLGSHHDLAMDFANQETVLGDFDDAEFTLDGITSRFYRRDGKFLVYTNGPGGETGEFEITHTFGWFPLQQYLVPFPGGRLQTLHIAWDSRDNRWFLASPAGPAEPDDWLYWTNAAQNWNGMCAQCHSTNLEKNYDPESDSYDTTWSDIDVGCEACHGPGSLHVAWAELPAMARPQGTDFGLARMTSGLSARELVEQCAPCHSRRSSLGDIDHTETDLMDRFVPMLLTEGLYFPDGQIQDEVYVYGSFIQSKMYRHDVRCSDCHDVHSIKLVKEGNELCLQCHRAAQYDTAQHHFHRQEGEPGEPIRSADGAILFDVGSGALCVGCHMPGRYYMVVDYRPDHGFRVPNPALDVAIGSPDPCLRCHVAETSDWSQQSMLEWYGPGRLSHYGEIIARGRAADPSSAPDLAALAADNLYPVNVRATALALLASFPNDFAQSALELGLMNEEALIRHAAIAGWPASDPQQTARQLSGLLYDPVLSVRIEAARRLVGPPVRFLDTEQRALYEEVLKEFESAMFYSADFPSSRHNLANLYLALDRPEAAIEQYRQALVIDPKFIPAQVNLAMLYNQRGQNQEAERLLMEALSLQPDLYDVAYSLGLLYAEMQRYDLSAKYLEEAARGLPGNPRIHYNLGLLYLQLNDPASAEGELMAALSLDPQNLDFQYALVSFYVNLGYFDAALSMAEEMARTHPDNPIGRQLIEQIKGLMPR
jgi:tetratricopeptide (TPR) repeat protein